MTKSPLPATIPPVPNCCEQSFSVHADLSFFRAQRSRDATYTYITSWTFHCRIVEITGEVSQREPGHQNHNGWAVRLHLLSVQHVAAESSRHANFQDNRQRPYPHAVGYAIIPHMVQKGKTKTRRAYKYLETVGKIYHTKHEHNTLSSSGLTPGEPLPFYKAARKIPKKVIPRQESNNNSKEPRKVFHHNDSEHKSEPVVIYFPYTPTRRTSTISS